VFPRLQIGPKQQAKNWRGGGGTGARHLGRAQIFGKKGTEISPRFGIKKKEINRPIGGTRNDQKEADPITSKGLPGVEKYLKHSGMQKNIGCPTLN